MPRQFRAGGSSSDQWKRQLPAEIREVLIYVESVAFREKGGNPSMHFIRVHNS